jgi:N-acetylglucosamine-6-sulfatase
MISRLVQIQENNHRLNNTVFIFFSDNGFHIGQHSAQWDKRLPYEHDLRIPLMVRAPGVSRGLQLSAAAVSIDIAPTVLDYAGIPTPPSMDGNSLRPVLEAASSGSQLVSWRSNFLVEYHGEGVSPSGMMCFGGNYPQCQDSRNNTYSCLRAMPSDPVGNSVYCEFQDSENFVEYYDLDMDPFQLRNGIKQANQTKIATMKKRLQFLMQCKGPICRG